MDFEIASELLDGKTPQGSIETLWTKYQAKLPLVNPANKRKYTVIVVGTGLAGGAAAASLGELGYRVLNFCVQDRRTTPTRRRTRRRSRWSPAASRRPRARPAGWC